MNVKAIEQAISPTEDLDDVAAQIAAFDRIIETGELGNGRRLANANRHAAVSLRCIWKTTYDLVSFGRKWRGARK